ncbi:MAG TPA: hypothetical protein V6D47_02965 [Oscillatoriaceae cyanobacterium]
MNLKYFVDYRLTPTALQIVGKGGAVVRREVPYSQMLEIRRGAKFWNEHWQSRWDSRGHCVSIRLKRLLLPWFVVTPDDPETFIAELKARVATAKQP